MFKPLLVAACAALSCGIAQAAAQDDFAKEASDATTLQPWVQPAGSVLPSDLTLDTGFGGVGYKGVLGLGHQPLVGH